MIEGSYGPAPALAANSLTAGFEALPSEADRRTALSILDASTCFVVPEEMPFAFSFYPAGIWVLIMKNAGFSEVRCRYWGSQCSVFMLPR